MTSLQITDSVNPSITGAPGFAHTVSFEARAKLYEFARFVRFTGKIAAIDNTAGDFSLFFQALAVVSCSRPGRWTLASRVRGCLSLMRINCRFSNCYGGNDGCGCDRGRPCQ